jgi:hypothetical protein
MRLGSQHFNTLNATGAFLVVSGVPQYEAVLITPLKSHDFVQLSPGDYQRAKWVPYDGIVRMALGPEDGDYQINLALKGEAPDSTTAWVGTIVSLKRTLPRIFITSPTNAVLAQPWLQIKGYSPLPLASVKYDFNGTRNLPGVVTAATLDPATPDFTTNYFQCYDLLLTNGINSITLRATDPEGNVFTTNFTVALNYSAATSPGLQIAWPQNGMDICGGSFTVRGKTEDAAAVVTAVIMSTNGSTTSVNGLVERDGTFWVEDLPLRDGTNQLCLTVKNSAGFSSATNISVMRSPFVLTMNPVKDDLWLPKVTVTGFESDGTYPVWVNGVKATVLISADGTGRWMAHNVPVTPGGVASFDMHAYGSEEIQPDGTYPDGRIATANQIVMDSIPNLTNKAAAQNPPAEGAALAVIPVQPVSIKMSQTGGIFRFTWNAVSNSTYQLQFVTDLTATNWLDLGNPITASGDSASASDALIPGMQRFYRVKFVR